MPHDRISWSSEVSRLGRINANLEGRPISSRNIQVVPTGHLHEHTITPAAPEKVPGIFTRFKNWVRNWKWDEGHAESCAEALANGVSPPRKIGNAKEMRDFFGAFAGPITGGTYYISPKDSYFKAAAKVTAASAWPFFLANLNFRLAAGRLKTVLSNLSNLHIIDGLSNSTKDAFAGLTQGASVFYGVYGSVMMLKRAYDIAYDTAADVANDPVRKEMQALLKDYDPVRKSFIDPRTGRIYKDSVKEARLKELSKTANTWNSSAGGGSIWRTRKQRFLDSAATVKDSASWLVAVPGSLMAVNATGSVATASGIMSAAGQGIASVNNFARMSVQATAINNIEHARRLAKAKVKLFDMKTGKVEVSKAVATNALLASVAKTMIQERTYLARSSFSQGLAYGISAIAGAVTAASVGTLGQTVNLLISIVWLTASGAATTIFERVHTRRLGKRREAAEKALTPERINQLKTMTPEQRRQFIETLDPRLDIGTLEFLLITGLREGSPEEVQEIFRFLHACGISKNTIKSFILEPSADAAKISMRNHMYAARTKFIPGNLCYTHMTAGYMSGVVYAKRALKGEGTLELDEIKQLLEREENSMNITESDENDVGELQALVSGPEAYNGYGVVHDDKLDDGDEPSETPYLKKNKKVYNSAQLNIDSFPEVK